MNQQSNSVEKEVESLEAIVLRNREFGPLSWLAVGKLITDPAILDHIPAVKALREENERLNLALMRANNVKIENSEASLMYRIADLESQLAELRQGGEPVGYVRESLGGDAQC